MEVLENVRDFPFYIAEERNMPYRPKKPCSFPGCPNLTDGRYCEKHRALEPERISGSRNGFYSSPEWKKVRKAFLLEHPFCAVCGRPATIVDHLVPIKDGGALLDENNFQPLCWSCHSKKSIEDGSRYRRKVYGYNLE